MCPGHPEAYFLEMVEAKKGYLHSHTGDTVALADSYTSVHFNDKVNVNCLCMVEVFIMQEVHVPSSTPTILYFLESSKGKGGQYFLPTTSTP